MTLFIKYLHVLTAFWFIAGLIGRNLTMWQAARLSQIHLVPPLINLAGYFERLMVIPGSMAVVVFGLLSAVWQGWAIFGFLQGSSSNWLFVSLLLTLSMIPVVRFVFLPKGKIFENALEDAVSQGQVTLALTNAFHDRAVAFAHTYEIALTIFIIYLMVAKPF